MTEATYQEKVEAGIAKATNATPTTVKVPSGTEQ